MDDKEKSVIDKMVDTVNDLVGSIAKSAVTPVDPEQEAVAEKANEQMFLGDAAIAPEAIPAPAPKKRRAPKKANKRVAKAARAPAKKTTKAASKRGAKKAPKRVAKVAKKTAKKTKKKSTR